MDFVEHLKSQIAALEAQKENLVAQAHQTIGALRALQALLTKLTTETLPEPEKDPA